MKGRTYTLLAILVSLTSFAFIFFNLENVRFYPQADEGYYFKYALCIANKGIGGFPDLFKEYIENKEHWIFPPPIRVGYIMLSAGWFKVAGASFLSLAQLSLFSFFCFLLTSFYFSKKHFRAETAFLLTFLLAFSPLNMGMASRALGDSTANLFVSLSIWLFIDILKEKNSLKLVIFILIYSFSILLKEAFVFLSPLFLFCLLFFQKKDYISFFSATLFPGLIVILILTALSTGLFIDTIKANASTFWSNQYRIFFGSGPWFRYVLDLIILSPSTALLSIGFIFYYISLGKKDVSILYFLIISIGIFLIFGVLPNKSVRYIIMLETPIKLFSLFMLRELFRERLKPLVFVIVGIIALFDYLNYRDLFVEKGIYDPVSFYLLRAKEIIP